ncbi:Nonribosomal peptide synthetase 13 [Apiospora saccharicola]
MDQPAETTNSSLSQLELDQIWERNASVPEQIQGCVHGLIAEVAARQPDALAVCAWDGNFTYCQLEDLSTKLARKLIALGAVPRTSIPLLFEKSRWTSVAMLAIIKAGCSAIALDGTQPDSRLRSIVEQARPALMVASAKYHARACLLSDVVVVQLDETMLDSADHSSQTKLPNVSPSDIVYISFTSGTTGQPKGACISHANVRSAVQYQGKELGFSHDSRVFDFAPYSFDVAWSNFLHTLCAGGCLCVASEDDMLTDLSAAITAFGATLINITPTVLRTVYPIPPSLQSVLLSGEMPYRENVTRWAGKVRLLNTYGPTECTFKGRVFLWIVDVHDDTKLAPLGSVGELYLEGPLVGQGYLSDPEKTTSAFIHDPPWLLAGSGKKQHPGRRGRLYKTGDLVKYRPDGNILFVGRKDASQLKIRGQRVEIGDVEHHVRAGLDDALPTIVDVITPQGTDVASLALFVVTKNQNKDTDQVKALMDGLAEKLRDVLPGFMIPIAYLPVDEIPVASTGKVDRRQLREFGSGMTWQQILNLQSTIMSVTEHHEPTNGLERRLRQIWADVLGLEASRISTHDSFLRLGGDSVAAMRVVAAGREQRLSLTVGDLFKTQTLVELAQVAKVKDVSDDEAQPIIPFSLLKGKRDHGSVCQDVAKLCGLDAASMEDVYPCTPLQEGMLAISVKSEGSQNQSDKADYVSRTAYELPQSTDLERFEKAWTKTALRAPILRTRIVDIPGEGLVQVVVKHDVPLGRYLSIAEFLEQSVTMGLGAPLCRAGLIRGDSGHHFVLEMHHAIFDGWVTALILDALETAYQEPAVEKPLVPFQPFMRHVLAADTPEAAAFWQRQLADSEATVFPSPSFRPEQKKDLSHAVSGLQWPRSSGITSSSVVRSALAVLMASYTNSSDVRFGATVSGRTAPIHGIEHIAGPTIATVPVRVRFDWDQTVQSLQRQIQQQAVELNQYEQYGLQRIQRIDEEASQFQILLVVQPARRGSSSQSHDGLFAHAKSIVGTAHKALSENGSDVDSDYSMLSQPPTVQLVAKDGDADSMGMYNDYAMMIICHLEDAGFTLQINFDSGAIKEEVVGRMAAQFEHLARQFCTEELAESKLNTVTSLTKHDLGKIWEWNQSVPKSVQKSVTNLIDERAAVDPDAVAISSWDKQLTYQQLKDLSTCLAYRLRQEGVSSGSVVILNFEKSSWLIVCMIAALRIGAVALPVSAPTLTSERAREMDETVHPKLVLTSSAVAAEENPFRGHAAILSVSDFVQDDEWLHVLEPHETLSTDPALILFTSGSTGAPKSILWSHETLSSNICAASASFGLTSTSKAFQFAGYEFDVSTVEALATLSAGGTLCIPSEVDRTNRLAGAISDFSANWICLTPSVSESLNPKELPSLKTIVFAGEKLSQKTARKWTESLDSVYNWYGPAEASVATFCLVTSDDCVPGMIGRSSSGGLTWLVDPKDRNLLAPVGAISELCIEGPIVAEYAGKNGAALNEKSFFSPPWLQAGYGEELHVPGRHGRLYQTGDLVKYDTDGRVVFIGRKHDSQRKLRGQRVELSEIELRVHESLAGKLEATVVAEIFCPESNDKETLALFVSPLRQLAAEEDIVDYMKAALEVDQLEQDLSKSGLPPYMVPKVYVPLAQIPTNHSGKTDRKRLRQIGSALTNAQLAAMQPSRKAARKPATAMEKRLQQLWVDVIGGGIEVDAIHATDNFLRLGGDSITAMRLVASARQQGLALTVADVFQSPLLEDMAKCVKYDDADADSESIAPFSLLGTGIDENAGRGQAARLCSVPESRIIDVYPCTALQQGLLALGARKHGQYVSRSVLRLQLDIDVERLSKAWLATVQKLPLLRTRIVDLPGQGLVQVVLDDLPLREATELDSYLRDDEETPMGLGTDLCRAAIIDRDFAFTIHHCTYDGNTLKMILEELESQYLGQGGLTVTPFQSFIHHLSKINPEQAGDFWKQQLSNTEAGQTGVTPSIIVRSAWAILASQYTSSSDVLFAVTVSGRQADMKGIETCAGPTISTVPVAITIDWENETVEAFLERLQRNMIETTPYEQFGLQNIYRVVSETLDPRLIQTLLVVQPVAEGSRGLDRDSLLFKARSFASNRNTLGTDPFNNYALQVVCELKTDGIGLRMSFDGKLIDPKQMRRMAGQFETVLQQLCSESMEACKLDVIQTASDADLEVFWAQNARVPDEAKVLVHDSIALGAKTQPDVIAIDAWDGRFSYSELDELSTDIAHRLMSMGISKGSVVALNSEKSKWVPLVQVAVYKAGGVTVLQSLAVPELRMAKVFKNIGVKLAVVSESRVELVSKHARCCTVEQLLQQKPPNDGGILQSLPQLNMDDPAAILVSSGSTGEPKQVLWSHRTLASNVQAHGEYLGIKTGAGTAVFQFASYDFDVSTIESVSTLVHTGRLCIPSEAERMDDLKTVINRFGVQFMNITPSTAKALHPQEITDSLEMLVLSGENLVEEDVQRWRGKCPVLNWYGPAEHPATIMTASDDNWNTSVIGNVYSKQPALCWLVDPRNQDKLVPFGTVGEISLEGPLCADGYIGNEAMTKQRFRDNLQFLAAGHGPSGKPGRQNHVYCSGDLGRYDTNGNLVYMGRKDAQLKIRGQLVAPEEVETQIRKWLCSDDNPDLEVVVDAVSREGGRNLTLVGYLTADNEQEVEKLTLGLNEKLGAALPKYAVPSYYIPVPSGIPTNASGKKDRKKLREMGDAYEPPRTATGSSQRREPTTTAERALRELWSVALKIDAEAISAHDSFLRVGDSIQAMRLVGMARQQGLVLTVAEVFEHPVLEEMAKCLKNQTDVAEDVVIAPFSLIDTTKDIQAVRQHAASVCGIAQGDVEDLFPCTPLQEGLLALTMKNPGAYTGRNILEITPGIDITKFKNAWEQVCLSTPILRTRILDLPGQGLVQAVIRDREYWTEADNLDDYLQKEKNAPMGLGSRLMRCAVFEDVLPDSDRTCLYFALTLHHSIYDGQTMPLILETLESLYHGATPLRPCPFQTFVKYIRGRDQKAEAAQFWELQFAGLEAAQFPSLPTSTYEPKTDLTLTHKIENVAWRADNATPSTTLRAAFALLCSHYSNSADVVFGTVVAGRKAPVAGIERIAGPTIATVPVRVKLDSGVDVMKLLSAVQSQATDMIPHEQAGLSVIRQINPEAQQACQFQTLLVIQPQEQNVAKDDDPTSLFVSEAEHGKSASNAFDSYALTLICTLGANREVLLEFRFDSQVISRDTVDRMSRHFEHLLQGLCSSALDETLLGDVSPTTDQDLDQIWKWNAEAFESVDGCVHDLITEAARRHPGATAVIAWDGELTYDRLDEVSSAIASHLVELGVKRNTIVPLCFEKSMYVPLAVLGVLKAGAAVLLLDSTLPESRLQVIVQQVDPVVILSSVTNEGLASQLGGSGTKTVVLGPDSSFMTASVSQLPHIQFDPSDLLYAVFTSGSTGTPKGCLMEHRNFTSATAHQQHAIQPLSTISRLYDFASYSFDAAVLGILRTLLAGAMLCIPSEQDRKGDLENSIKRFGTTDIYLTSSTARLVDPERIPTMRNIYLAGEVVTGDDVSRWTPHANTFVGYGPAECTVGTVWYQVPNNSTDIIPSPLPIGKGAGASTWIVNPKSSERLVPVGAVGELYLEGPLKTSAVFIQDPSWLLRGSPDGRTPGRRGRLYKTGDLVQYSETDGNLVFVGRKDTQVKLRGQRIELGEVEHHIRQYLSQRFPAITAVAEVVVPAVTKRAALVAFVQLPHADWPRFQESTADMEEALQQCLPTYMVPSAYVPVELIPLAVSGKTDRKRLREMGASLTLEQLDGGGHNSDGQDDKKPVTESELRLQELWVSVLRVPADKIRADSSFLRLGGDSITAMRLTALARRRGISLTVPNILQKPKLCEMAKTMTKLQSDVEHLSTQVPAFSLLKNATKDAAVASITSQCGGNIEAAQIQDAFPCTGVQKSLLSMTAKADNSYIARFLLRLRGDIDVPRFQKAWEDVSRTTAPILRYRIVDTPSEGLVQVQVDEPLTWDTANSVDAYLESDKHQSMGLGERLTRLAFIDDKSSGDPCCILTQHHAIYDGYSVDLLLGQVAKAYAGQVDKSPVAPFQSFIKHVVDVDQEDAKAFWRGQFTESEAVPFPALPSENYRPKADSTVRRNIVGFTWPKRDATSSTIIRTAWSILAARYTGTDDVVFGTMVTGRQGSLPGIDRMIAPLINAVPVRVKFDPTQNLDELLHDVQQQSVAMIPYEHTELLDIRRLGGGAEAGSRFNTLLVVQPAGQKDYVSEEDQTGPFRAPPETLSSRDGLDDFNPNAVMLMCQLTPNGGIELEISFDSHVVDSVQMGRMAAQFEHVIRQLCAAKAPRKIEDVETVSAQDLAELWEWNATVPETISACVHDLIGETMRRHPQDPAICAWDGNLSYAELDDLSHKLALHLVSLGVGPGMIVPLCFEKSVWYPVAALAVMRSGAACLAMDATQPEARLRSIVQQVNAKLVLASINNKTSASRLSDAQVVIVDKEHIPDGTHTPDLPKVSPMDTLYIVFTSGSTGVPKGIVTTHQNFASAATYQSEILHISHGTRVFDFVSYNFDVSWSNHLQTLIAGGCLCIPSETKRRNDIIGAFNRMGCDYTYFTPSVAHSLDPAEMPLLKTLAMGGEPIQNKEVARWTKQADTIIGIYGPAECAQALSFARLTPETRNNHVGHPYGANTWLVQPGNPNRLAALGTVAELAIEGPTVSQGYFGNAAKTATTYISNPAWLISGSGEHPGRKGRLYVTGDLLRYNSDGSLDFIGRKDALVKLRGQRIELAEVEYHVGTCLRDPSIVRGAAAEIITPKNSNSPILAVFLSVHGKEGETAKERQAKLMPIMEDLEQLPDRVPQYMVPGAYIEIDQIPMTTTNKTDRRALRELGGAKTLEELAALQSHGKERRMPSSPMEKTLQGLWSAVLQINPASISADSNFLRIGGESIAAMRLVAAARAQKLSLTVADIFKAPRLSDLALLVKEVTSSSKEQTHVPFSLLKTDDTQDFLEKHIAPHIEGGLEFVRDVLPATDFQQQSVLDALQDPPGRYPHWILDLPADVDFVRLQQACVKLVNHFDILRSVFVRDDDDGRFWQVVLTELKPTYDTVDAGDEDVARLVDSICAEDIQRPRVLGRSFIRFIVIKHASSGKHKFILRISHAQFDGFSWGSVLEALWSIYNQQDLSLSAGPSFSQYIAYSESKRQESQAYWRSRLQGSPTPIWKTNVTDEAVLCNPANRLTMKETIPIPSQLISQAQDGVSVATLFHAACALVLSRHYEQPKIVLGRLVTGRAMLPGHLQNVVGPTMTEVPIRITISPEEDTVSTLASRLQAQFLQDAAHEAVGMVQMIRNCTDWLEEVNDFGWRTSFQQQQEEGEGAVPPRARPEIYATPTKDGKLELEFEGNRELIEEEVVREVLAGLREVLK